MFEYLMDIEEKKKMLVLYERWREELRNLLIKDCIYRKKKVISLYVCMNNFYMMMREIVLWRNVNSIMKIGFL